MRVDEICDLVAVTWVDFLQIAFVRCQRSLG